MLLVLLEFYILLGVGFLLLRDSLHLIDKLTLADVLVISLGSTLLTSWLIKVVLFVYNA